MLHVYILSQAVCLHIVLSGVLFVTINEYIHFKDNVLVPFGSIIIVNIKKFNYREHNYVVHNYNAPPTALRESVGREDNHVCKSKVGNKIDGVTNRVKGS